MSHKKYVDTVYVDKDALAAAFTEAAQEFGLAAIVEKTMAVMYNGERVPVDFCIRRTRNHADFYYGDMGIAAQANGTFRMVIDDLDADRYNVRKLLERIEYKYAYSTTMKTLQAQGWELKETRADDGTITISAIPTRQTARTIANQQEAAERSQRRTVRA